MAGADGLNDAMGELLGEAGKLAFSRNNYLRSVAYLVLGSFSFVATIAFGGYGSDIVGVVFLPAILLSLIRGIWKDLSSKIFFSRSPTARELTIISQKPHWNENRRRLLTFPYSVSDRDAALIIEGHSLVCNDPVRALSEMQGVFEAKALSTFQEAAHCYRLKRLYDNYPKGELCPLPKDLPENRTGASRTSFQTLCFCQRRKDHFFPYLVMVYIHVFIEGQRVKSRIYAHGFSFSTWFGKDDERLKTSSLIHDVAQMWNEAIAQHIETNRHGTYHTTSTEDAGQRTRGRTDR